MKIIPQVQNLQPNIAQDAWPDGGVLECEKCGYQFEFTTKQAGHYLAHGWPNHCGTTMRIADEQ